MDKQKIKTLAEAVLNVEAEAITHLKRQINDDFIRACGHMLACEGRIVVTGMGKSGHIGNKIAATLASTGSPAFFLHPGEASHGDLGMITPKDVVLALSNSGETDEILTILPLIKRMKVPLITLTGNPGSRLATAADVNLDVSVEKEACPLGLAPTASTTAALAMGDALAVSLLEERGFTSDDFALSHPGGRLGRRLLLHISDIMHGDRSIPAVAADATLGQALLEMSNKGLGMTTIVDADGKLLGVFTDGDLRRLMDHTHVDVHNMRVADHMTTDPKHARPDMLAAEALQMMEQYKINALPVVDADNTVVGAMNFQDLLKAGVV
jgi:arabinose-5-phosphate isomerase